MSRGKRSDTATSADWDFLSNEETLAGLAAICTKIAWSYGIDAGDLYQDLMLWIAVRPWNQAYEDLTDEETRSHFLSWARQHAHDLAKAMGKDVWKTEPLPTADEDEW